MIISLSSTRNTSDKPEGHVDWYVGVSSVSVPASFTGPLFTDHWAGHVSHSEEKHQ